MQLLLIKISSLEATPEYALLGKKQIEDRFTPGDWKKVQSLTRGRRVVLLLPDNEVLLSSVSLPSNNKKHLAQAVPFALEESLAEDIEDLHFSIHNLGKKKKMTKASSAGEEKDRSTEESLRTNYVAVINRKRLSNYIEKLSELHIPVHFVLPQLFSIEQHENSWTLLAGDETTQLRLDEFSGFSCNNDMLNLFLPEQLEKETPEALYSNLPIDYLPESLKDIPLSTTHDSGLVKRDSIMSALPLNLLSGFVRERKASKIDLKPWKPAFALIGLLAAVWLGILGWQNQLLSKQRNQLDNAITNVYKNTFPNGRIVDAPQQMASKLSELQGNRSQTIQSPLPLVASISPLLKKHKDMTLREIRYQDNKLSLVVRTTNLSQLETFKKEADTKAKLNIDIKSSTTTANKVEATLVITSKEGST